MAKVRMENNTSSSLRLRCPVCGRSEPGLLLDQEKRGQPARCSCGFVFAQIDGIWKALTLLRQERLRLSLLESEVVGLREWREQTVGDPQRSGRGRFFRCVERRILPKIEKARTPEIRALEIGAGNGWISYSLALRGYRSVAVELRTNKRVGLGVARCYLTSLSHPFYIFQADPDCLPFDDYKFDLAIWSSAFRHQQHGGRVLGETLRCLRRAGHVVFIGGTKAGALTTEDVQHLAYRHGLVSKGLAPGSGLSSALKPLKEKILGQAQPPHSWICWATAGAS